MKSLFQYFDEKEKYDKAYLYIEGYGAQMLKYCQKVVYFKMLNGLVIIFTNGLV